MFQAMKDWLQKPVSGVPAQAGPKASLPVNNAPAVAAPQPSVPAKHAPLDLLGLQAPGIHAKKAAVEVSLPAAMPVEAKAEPAQTANVSAPEPEPAEKFDRAPNGFAYRWKGSCCSRGREIAAVC